jgi:F-type H+-transporting ATPase subunit b
VVHDEIRVAPRSPKALDERAQKIAEGLSAADKAKAELVTANKKRRGAAHWPPATDAAQASGRRRAPGAADD